jgi:hypothetical protein
MEIVRMGLAQDRVVDRLGRAFARRGPVAAAITDILDHTTIADVVKRAAPGESDATS